MRDKFSIFGENIIMGIGENITEFKKILPDHVKLVAVSKTKTPEIIMVAYNAGQRIFGENKVQDMVEKYEALPKDIEWHFIGHLQTNKVKHIAPFVSLIHAVDSLKLLRTINKEAVKNNRKIPCLLQFFIAQEETKFGMTIEEAKTLLESEEYLSLKNIEICGVMGMATYTNDENQVRNDFRMLHSIFQIIKSKYFSTSKKFTEISMGMSDDFQLSIEEGSTMIRVGTSIFGVRNS